MPQTPLDFVRFNVTQTNGTVNQIQWADILTMSVPPGGSTTIVFRDGTQLVVDESITTINARINDAYNALT